MWKPLVLGLLVALVATLSPVGLEFNSPPQDVSSPDLTLGQYQMVLTIGTDVFAAGVADYTCDGVADDEQFQAALDALPATGGKLVALTGDYVFAATVFRAIDDVTIDGMGDSTYFAYDAGTALFDAGTQDGWVFRNFRTDAGGVDVTGTTDYVITNVTVGTDIVGKITRTATFVVAASDSSDSSKAQADWVCSGVDDQVEIQAAITTATVSEGRVVLLEGNFNCTSLSVSCPLEGQGEGDIYDYNGTNINLITNASTITVTKNGKLRNLKVSVLADYTGTAVLIEGEPYFISMHNVYDNLTIYHAGAGATLVTGTALLIRGIGTDDDDYISVTSCSFGSLYIYGFEYGVSLYAIETIHEGFVNGNIFGAMNIWYCRNPIALEGVGTADVQGNIFQAIEIQPLTAVTVNGIHLIGKVSHNHFVDIFCWDWVVATGAKLVIDSGVNYIYAMGNLSDYIDNGLLNTILDTSSPGGEESYTNMLPGGNFEVGNPPVMWAALRSTLAQEGTIIKVGARSAKITVNDAGGAGNAGIEATIPDFARYQGSYVTLGAWFRADSSNDKVQKARLFDGVAATYTSTVPKDDAWHWLVASIKVDDAATMLHIYFIAKLSATADTDDILYVDGAILVEGRACPAFSPKPDDALICHHTAAYTISQYETGNVLHTNLGAGGAIQIELPQVVDAGFICRFAVTAAFELRVHPGAAGAIYINGAKQTDDKYITADDEAESVILTADGNGDWIASSVVGTWGVEG